MASGSVEETRRRGPDPLVACEFVVPPYLRPRAPHRRGVVFDAANCAARRDPRSRPPLPRRGCAPPTTTIQYGLNGRTGMLKTIPDATLRARYVSRVSSSTSSARATATRPRSRSTELDKDCEAMVEGLIGASFRLQRGLRVPRVRDHHPRRDAPPRGRAARGERRRAVTIRGALLRLHCRGRPRSWPLTPTDLAGGGAFRPFTSPRGTRVARHRRSWRPSSAPRARARKPFFSLLGPRRRPSFAFLAAACALAGEARLPLGVRLPAAARLVLSSLRKSAAPAESPTPSTIAPSSRRTTMEEDTRPASRLPLRVD